jgi:hypothetical protein
VIVKAREKRRVACVACGRLIVASKNGHPRRHAPIDGLRNSGSAPKVYVPLGTCDGTFLPGVAP